MENKTITWDAIPDLLSTLLDKVDTMSKKLENLQYMEKGTGDNGTMDVYQLSNYLPGHPAVQTIYQWCSKKTIPYHKLSKRLFFVQSEIDEWLQTSKCHTLDELQAEALMFIQKKKGGKR